MRSIRIFSALVFICLAASVADARQFRLALFQAGDYAPFSAVQTSFDRSLTLILPQDTTFQFQASAFSSAEWNRDSSRVKARQLAARKDIDIVITIGPWVTEDLLEAGYTGPIIALGRTDPYLEGLSDSTYRSNYRNLTVQAIPNKVENDIALLHRLKPFKKLGVLFFPTGMDSSRLLSRVESICQSLGTTSTSAFGHNNLGTYAYLKAYAALPSDVDAVYLFPLWGLDAERIKELSGRVTADRRSSVSYEGLYAVDKGMLISSAVLPHEAEARFAAWKALQIFRGTSPQSLPTQLPFTAKLSINTQTAASLAIDITLEMSTEAELIRSGQDQPLAVQTLSDVVTKAFDLNPGFVAWQDRIAQAETRSGLARTSLRPTLTAQGSVDYVDDHSVHNDQLLVPTPELIRNERYQAGLSLDLPVWSLESNRQVSKANIEMEMDRASQDSASLALESEVAISYFDALRAQSARSIQQLQIHLANTTAEIARGMVATGERPRAELTRWRAEELYDRQLVAALETDLRTTQIRLNAIMNQPSGNAILLDSTLLSEDAFWHAYELIRPYIATEANRLQTINQLVRAALHESPSSRRAAAAINTQSAQISVLRSTPLPTVGVRSTLDFTDELGTYGDLDEQNPSWSVGAYVRWPLFDGGRRKKEIQIARARLSELEYLKDQNSLQLMDKISRLVRELAGAAAQAIAAEREAALSTAIVASAIENYSSGVAGIDATLQPGQSASDAQNRLVDARARFLASLYRVVCVVGWSPHRESVSPAQLLRQRLSGK